MSGLPTQGSTEQVIANALTNKALASRIENIWQSRRAFPKAEADAYLEEAMKRLRWPDNYEAHR